MEGFPSHLVPSVRLHFVSSFDKGTMLNYGFSKCVRASLRSTKLPRIEEISLLHRFSHFCSSDQRLDQSWSSVKSVLGTHET
jgi:hypothetical protein